MFKNNITDVKHGIINKKRIRIERRCFMSEYRTHVNLGRNLLKKAESVKTLNKRFLLEELNTYLQSDLSVNTPYYGKVCALYGLRRTGKTTVMLQSILDLADNQFNKIAWIDITEEDTMASLYLDLQKLNDDGYQYVFIDEITKSEQFVRVSSLLSDEFALSGMHIVLTGTDSLGIYLSQKGELFDRVISIHTTYIPYYEYLHLFPQTTVDEYIERGGLLSESGRNYNNDKLVQEYVDSAIAENIQHSLSKLKDKGDLGPLYRIHSRGELTNVINRVIEDKNHEFFLETILKNFESHDMGALRHYISNVKDSNILSYSADMDLESLSEQIKKDLKILNYNELKYGLSINELAQIEKYLYDLDFFDDVKYYTVSKETDISENPVIVQPCIRYNQVKSAMNAMYRDPKFIQLSESNQEFIINKLLSDIKGRLLEEIVLLNATRSLSDCFVAQCRFYEYRNSPFTNGEYDMLIRNKKDETFLFEIKHSSEIQYDQQTKHLLDTNKLNWLEKNGFRIKEKFVLYNGETLDKDSNGITYLNVSEFLEKLKDYDRNYIKSLNKQYETSIEDSSNKDIDVINNLEFYKQFYESTDEFDNITEEESKIEQNNHDDGFQI